jgi:type III secretion system (T3SS) inner membrane Yop/YscD-like protein
LANPDKPDFDPEKTAVDLRRPETSARTDDAGEKTTMMPSPVPGGSGAKADEGPEKTVLMKRPAISGGGAAADADKTIVGARRPAGPKDTDKTMVGRMSTAVASGPPSDYEIVILSGQARGRRFTLPDAEALIGSNPTCHVVVPGIEGVHAKLQKQDDGFEIQNLGTEGSLVVSGGRRPQRAKLKGGDLIKVGEVVLRFVKTGEVFSSEYSDAELASSALGRLLDPQYRMYLLIGVAAAVVLLLVLWPGSDTKQRVVRDSGNAESNKQRAKQVDALLAAGEVLFNEGRLISPSDQPDAESAFGKFNEVLALNPGNEKALAWLKRIDEEREKDRRAREAEEQRRAALERERRDRERQELAAKVNAIIADGDQLFQKGQVAEPAGNNALKRYRDALKVDPESTVARERVDRAFQYYIDRGDQAREGGDPWTALENYRKASRAAEGKNEDIEARVRETETRLKAGMAGTDTPLVIYRDEKGQTVVVDDIDKVPARYRDRAVTVLPIEPGKGGGGVRR